jgi:uncharacterized DUF497 family protein
MSDITVHDDQLSFMNVKLNIGNKQVYGDLSKDLEIPEDIEELAKAIDKYPSMLAYWGSVAEAAKGERDLLEQKYDRWYAELYLQAKEECESAAGKKAPTEAFIKSYMLKEYGDQIEEKKRALVTAEYRRSMALLVFKCVQEKGSSMINVLSYRKMQYQAETKSQY